MSLRNGPAGIGTYTFPTDAHTTVDLAKAYGLEAIVELTDQPSLIAGKKNVLWAKLAFIRN